VSSGGDEPEGILKDSAVGESHQRSFISKDFKGGDIVIFFGGLDINFTQADLTGPVHLEITQVFGGVKLIVPANWRIRSEVVNIFGSFEDKRVTTKEMQEGDKVLTVHGTSIFGSIDVKSH